MNRINYFTVFILFFFMTVCFSQEVVIENDSLLLWQADRPLKWEDFKGVPKPVRVHNAAGTGMTIYYTNEVNIYGEVEVNPLCYFEKCRSWTNTNDDETLEHEQLHFDIQELYTRKLRKIFITYQERRERDNDVYTATTDSIFNICESVQNEYDHEVLANYSKFLEWKSKVAKELEELKEYEYVPEE